MRTQAEFEIALVVCCQFDSDFYGRVFFIGFHDDSFAVVTAVFIGARLQNISETKCYFNSNVK